jgi:hypothetical protein
MSLLATSPALVAVHLLAAAIWIGGFVAIAVVARAARSALDPAGRVAFFRMLGRAYGVVGGVSLLVALGTGLVLLPPPRTGALDLAAVALGLALLAGTGAGVRQARAMTRLRTRAIADPHDPALARMLRRGTVSATVLRAAIGLLTLALLGLASVIAA